MDYFAVVNAMEEQDRLFEQLQPKYKEFLERKEAPKREELVEVDSGAMLVDAAPPQTAGPGMKLKLEDLLTGATEIAAGKTAAITFLEQRHDPKVFKVPLLTTTWDSLRGMAGSGRGAEVFIAKLPNFNYDIGRGIGNNALFVHGEYFNLASDDRVWLAVNVAATESTAGELLCHAAFRTDPIRAAGAAGTGTLRRRYTQGYRLGIWETKTLPFRGDGGDCPIRPGVKFWWRIVVHPAGFLSYINGRLMMFSPHPPTGRPQEWDTLFAQLPSAGEKAELATWRVHAMWWGAVGVSAEDERAVRAALAETGGRMPAWSPFEVRVSGIMPAGVPLDEVRAAFAHYGVAAAHSDSPHSAVLRLADAAAVPHVLLEMEGATAVRPGAGGQPLHVARVLLASADAAPVTAAVAAAPGFYVAPSGGGAGSGAGVGGMVPTSPAYAPL